MKKQKKKAIGEGAFCEIRELLKKNTKIGRKCAEDAFKSLYEEQFYVLRRRRSTGAKRVKRERKSEQKTNRKRAQSNRGAGPDRSKEKGSGETLSVFLK